MRVDITIGEALAAKRALGGCAAQRALSPEHELEVVRLYLCPGHTLRSVAAYWGIGHSTVARILARHEAAK